MATARKWSNVAVAMQSAIATPAKTITGITLASTGVATSSTHGYSNGDYVLILASGMFQVNGRVFRVAGVATDTFQIEGENTTSYDAFTSGTCQKLTFGTTVSTVTNLSASGGDLSFIDTTTIHSNIKTEIPGATNPLSYSIDNIWDVSDAGLIAMKAAYDASAQRAFKFTFGTGGQIMVFNGYVGASLAPTGSAQNLVTTPATITVYGTPTYYSS
jgi:hypothetical protein